MSIIQIMCHNGNYWQTGLLDNESAEDVLNRISSLFSFFFFLFLYLKRHMMSTFVLFRASHGCEL